MSDEMKDWERRAMSEDKARLVKLAGHRNEAQFAALIGGQVNRGDHVAKKDVIDAQHNWHSVKAGGYWQIFLYRRDRFLTNTLLRGIDGIADIMLACLDAYPDDHSDYLADKKTVKSALAAEMRRLLAAMQKPNVLPAFLQKALFEGGEVQYLTVWTGPAKSAVEEKEFHVFAAVDVVSALVADVELQNSKARSAGQFDDQKVLLVSKSRCHNLGEIEVRHDSVQHYREMKFRLQSERVMAILFAAYKDSVEVFPQVFAHGKAIRAFKP